MEFHTQARSAMLFGSGAVTPGPSCECNITSFGNGQPKLAQPLRDSTVAAHRVQRVRYSHPG